MPIYEYECRGCGHVQEVLQRSSREQAPSCPECGSEETQRLLPAARAHMGRSGQPASTCCGRDVPCDSPPCADGICSRN